MKAFAYVAIGPNGVRERGQWMAVDERELDAALEKRGAALISAEEIRAQGGALRHGERIQFATQLAVTVEAGVPLLEALQGLAERSTRGEARTVIERVAQSLRAGMSFSDALAREPASFPEVFRASVQAGEASGSLGSLLSRVAEHMEWQQSVRGTVRQALVYPAFLGAALLGLVVLMLTFLIPRIAGLYPGGRADLPWPTQLVMGASDQLRALGPVLLLGCLVLLGVWFAVRRTPAFREGWARFLLSLPILGSVLHQVATSRFAAVAATLQSAGCDIRTVIHVAAKSCGNAAIAASLERVGEGAQKGRTLSDGLAQEPLSDPLLRQLVAVGESSGDLDGCLARLAAWYDQEVPRRVKRFLGVLEPTMLLISAVLVGFLLLATLLPIFQLYDKIG